METYTPLYSSILDSTVWREPDGIRIVWVTLMAMADRDGCVWASIPGIADRAKVNLDVAREAIHRFMAPDPDSRSENDDGRRLQKIDRGFKLINYSALKERCRIQAARERKRRWAAKHRAEDGNACVYEKSTVDASRPRERSNTNTNTNSKAKQTKDLSRQESSKESVRDRLSESLEMDCPPSIEFTQKETTRAKRCGQSLDDLYELFRAKQLKLKVKFGNEQAVHVEFEAWLLRFANNEEKSNGKKGEPDASRKKEHDDCPAL